MNDEQFNRLGGILEHMSEVMENIREDITQIRAQGSLGRISAGGNTAEDKVASMKCPTCGGAMSLRTSRKTGNSFAGCVSYPSCSGIRWLSGDVPPPREAPRPSRQPFPPEPKFTPSDDAPF